MRILFFTDKLTRGGAEKQIAQLAQPLHAAGHTICVMTIRPEGYWADWLKLQGIRVEQQDLVLWHEGRARSLLKIARLALAFRRFRPDVVISNKYHNSIWAMLAGRLAGVRLRIAYRVALSY
ncbi:MAG: glycosyltransferase, partial [Anaerolineae bacterium]